MKNGARFTGLLIFLTLQILFEPVRADIDDKYWHDMNTPASGPGFVNALTAFNGRLYAAWYTQPGCRGASNARAAIGTSKSYLSSWDGSCWNEVATIGAVPCEDTDDLAKIEALCVFQDWLFCGGSFSPLDGAAVGRIAGWDGTAWHSPGTGVDSTVWCLEEYNAGLVAGGEFLTAGGLMVNRIAEWNGSNWRPLGDGLNGPVYALAEYDGELIAGGDFTLAGSSTAYSVARWDGANWYPLGLGTDGPVRALMVYSGELYVGGDFYLAGGVISNNIARWNGTAWTAVGSGTDGAVYTLFAHDSALFAGGNFSSAGGTSGNDIALWDGISWQMLNSPSTSLDNLNAYNQVTVLKAYGDLLVAGTGVITSDDFFGPGRTGTVAQWNDTAWNHLRSWTWGVGGPFCELNNDLIVGSARMAQVGWEIDGMARWDGFDWQAFVPGLYQPEAFETFNDDWVAGGRLWLDNVAQGVVRWDGAIWQAIESEMGLNNGYSEYVKSLIVYEGNLIAAGWFRSIDGVVARDIARWDGYNWQPLGTGIYSPIGYAEVVDCVTIYNGDLIAGGEFTTAGGVDVNNVARWDGTAWHPLSDGLNGRVYQLVEFQGELIARGFFTLNDGSDAKNLARWDGTQWHPVGEGVYSQLQCMIVYENELIVGAYYSEIGGMATNHIARWDGMAWKPLGSGVNGAVTGLHVYNNELIVTGDFSEAGGQSAICVAKWNKPQSCCLGYTGNVDNDPADLVDIGDLTALIDYLFITYTEPLCLPEANTDGEGDVDIADLTTLIQHLFIPPYSPPAVCH